MTSYFKYVDIDNQVERKFGKIIQQTHLEFVNDKSSKYYDLYITYDKPYYHVVVNHGKLLISFDRHFPLEKIIDANEVKTHSVFSKSSLINEKTAYDIYQNVLSSKLAKGYLSIDRITNMESLQIDIKSTLNCRLIDLY